MSKRADLCSAGGINRMNADGAFVRLAVCEKSFPGNNERRRTENFYADLHNILPGLIKRQDCRANFYRVYGNERVKSSAGTSRNVSMGSDYTAGQSNLSTN